MSERGHRKERTGVVVSNKAEKTVTVSVERRLQHKLYRKVLRVSKKYHAHDPENSANVGDTVRIRETRPISKTKCWKLVEIVKRAE